MSLHRSTLKPQGARRSAFMPVPSYGVHKPRREGCLDKWFSRKCPCVSLPRRTWSNLHPEKHAFVYRQSDDVDDRQPP